MNFDPRKHKNNSKHSISLVRPGFLLGLVMVLLVSANSAMAAHPYQKWADEFDIDLAVSYDARRLMQVKDMQMEAAEYRAPGKMYTEVQMGNMSSGIILREDLGKAYLLMPSMGFYQEQSLEDGFMAVSNGMEFSEIEKVGNEDINGHPSIKFKTRFEDQEGKGAGFFWVTETGIPIKMDMIYSSRGEKGQRITMQLTELNIREQDPARFEIPEGLKPMGFSAFGQLMSQGAQAEQPQQEAPQATSEDSDLSARQQACLEEAVKAAEEKQEQEKKKRAFGKLLGAVASAASRFGSSDLARTTSDVYAANATAQTVAEAAEELGITEEEVERCREP